MSGYEVSGLWRYPVKSMAGERLETVTLTAAGIDGDRRWAVRDLETGKVASAKRPRPYGALLHWSARLDEDGAVEVRSPDGATCRAGDPSLDEALSEALGRPVAMAPVEEGRDEAYDSEWPDIPGTSLSNVELELPVAMMTGKSSFVDLAAIHLVLESSMAHLAERSGAEVGVERFRPNVLLAGGSPDGFADLDWREVDATVGETRLRVADAAPRCVMTTLDNGAQGPAREVLATLAVEARKDFDLGTYACFGTYAEVERGGTVTVGDRFTLE